MNRATVHSKTLLTVTTTPTMYKYYFPINSKYSSTTGAELISLAQQEAAGWGGVSLRQEVGRPPLQPLQQQFNYYLYIQ